MYAKNNLPQIFVLWGENFDERMAISIVSKLRESSLRVKIVGLRGKQTPGMYGVTVVPDMILSQALPLAKLADCVVVPCHSPHFAQIDNDPRVHDFFQEASSNNAQFVTGKASLAEMEKMTNPLNVLCCLAHSEIDESVERIKNKLSELV